MAMDQQQFHLRAPAHPIPPQPAYYAPPPPPPVPRWSYSCLVQIIVIVITLLGVAAIVLWTILSPSGVRATAVSATLSRFDLADGPSGGRGEGTLQYNLTVGIRVRNRNPYRISYDHAEAQASYNGERFGYDPVEPFDLKGTRGRTLTAAFVGSSPVEGGDTVHMYQRERSDGFYFVKVGLYSDLSFQTRYSNVRRKSNISCTLRLPVPDTSATPLTTQLGTTCDVHVSSAPISPAGMATFYLTIGLLAACLSFET